MRLIRLIKIMCIHHYPTQPRHLQPDIILLTNQPKRSHDLRYTKRKTYSPDVIYTLPSWPTRSRVQTH